MVLLFRVGDDYEIFDDDAVSVAKLLHLTLKSVGPEGRPFARFASPFLEAHLRTLLQTGHRVAVCDSAEDQP